MRYYIDNYLCTYNPDGWKDDTVTILRNDKKGIYREVSQELTFVKDGAEKLRRAFYTYGVHSDVDLKVDRFDKNTMQWKTIFNGKFDFSTFQDLENGVTCTATDGTASGVLKAKEDIKYNIELTELLYFDETKTWNSKILATQLHSQVQKSPVWVALYSRGFATMDLTISSSTDKSAQKYTVVDRNVSNNLFKFWDTNADGVTKAVNIFVPTFTATAGITSDYNPANNNLIYWGLYYGLVSSPLSARELYFTNGTMVDTGGGSANYSFTVPEIDDQWQIETNDNEEYAYFIAMYPAHAGYQNYLKSTVVGMNSTIRIDVATEMINYGVYCEPANEMFEKIINEIDSTLTVKTDYLDTLCATSSDKIPVFTSGQALRQIPNPTISISLNDFYKTMNALFDVGLGVETISSVEYVSCENTDYFYDTTKSYALGTAKSVTLEPMKVPTKIIAGYEKNEYQVPNGREEFCSEQEWYLPAQNVEENSIDLRCPARADHIGILQTLLSITPANVYKDGLITSVPPGDAEDRKEDNETFVLDCEYNSGQSRYEAKPGQICHRYRR
jgi:hypothetical protein